MAKYDVLIPFHEKDLPILSYCIASVKQNAVGAQTIFIVSEKRPDIDDSDDCIWIPEAHLPFSKEDVSSYIHSETRIGWYYQQLLKLFAFHYLPTKLNHLLILDSDVILKKQVSFFSEEGHIYLASSEEHTEAYFTHMSRLLPGLTKQISDTSGICHHFMLKREHVEYLLETIVKIHNDSAWKVMLRLVDPEDYNKSGMSEYEILFNFCLRNYPNEYRVRPLQIDNLSTFGEFNQSKADMVALHAWARTL